MAYRGGGRGGRGDQRPQYGHARGPGGPGGGRPSGFVWPPPATTPRQVPVQYQVAPMGYRAPMPLPHQAAYAAPAVVYRGPAPVGSQVVYAPAPAAVPVTIRAPPAAPSPAPAPQGASSRTTTAPTPRTTPAPAPASSAPSATALAKEVEKKLFVSETALAPPAAAAAAAAVAAAVSKEGATAVAEAASDVDLAPVSKKGLAHPARPGRGTCGKSVMIRANHFLVDVADNNLFHYDVSINPESKSRATNREVLSELIKLYGNTSLGGKLPAYDGRKSLYTAGSLPFESEEFVVKLVDPEKKEKERAEREYKITIRIAGRTDMYHLTQFLHGRQRDMPQETIQVLDVVLRESPSWNYVTVSRSFFSTTFGHRGDIGEGLECWRGYYQSLRPTQMGLSLNIDISATSFFKPVTVIKFVEEFLNIRDTSRPLSDRDRVKIKKALRGVRIETSHQEDQIRRYKITGLTPIPMSQLIFPTDDKGTRKSVAQYFWDKYNYSLKYGSWPCLQAGSDSRPVYLPMEVCKIVEGQRYSKKLNDRQVTNILRATCKRPQEREKSIRDMVLHNRYAEDRFAQEFGIKVCNELVSVPARVLPPPLLKYNDSGREKTCAPSVGQWNMINKKMINGGTVDNWTCLNFSRMRPEEVQRFCMDLVHMCNATGMSFNPNPFVEVRSAAPNHIENALRDAHRRATQMLTKQGMGNQLQLLVVILPELSGSYGKIKRVCETDIGIVSQCCLPKHASRPNKQYLENVALKINVKVGGRNTVLERAFVRNGIPFVSEVPTIIFGADVTHPPPGEDSASSIAAVVASMDWPEITKYRGLVSAQPHRQEIIEDLFTVSKDPQKGHNVNGGMIREMLIAFRRKTNRRPERIIFYRDGVSEGQFSHVLLHEMDAIRKACASLEEGYLPPVTFVVVQKRHHTRLFPEFHGRRDMTDKSGNILPGTVVDQKICHPIEFDFYLCSHAGIQGTSLPTHYHVLYDENHFTADALQSLTNNLCYTYARCTHAVSVALRARCYYVEGETSDGGSTPGSSGQAVAQEGPVEVRQLPKIKDNVKEKSYASSISQWNMINKKIINGGTMGRTLCGMLQPTLLHKRIWSTLISNSIPNTVTFSLDGPPWQVLINYINAILHIRLWFMSRGARIDLSPLFGTESNIYTTPPDGSFFLEITFKGDSLDVIFDGREAWFKGLINKFGPLEFQPSVGKLQYIDHQGCKILDFTGYYDDLAPNGEPGQIKIGHGALIDTFLEACVHRGQPSTLEFRHKLGTIVVHFGEAPKFHWVFLCCCISIIKERMTTLDCFDNDLGVMLRKWGKLCKDVVSLLMHWLSSRGEPALNAFVEDIAKRKVPFISTVSDVLANICFYSHNSPNSKSFQNSPQPERVKWSPKDPTDKVGTRTWLVNHWPEKKSAVFCSAMWRCHLPIQHSGAIVPINQLGRSRFTTCAHIPLNSMTIGNSRCIYTAAATVWRLLKK